MTNANITIAADLFNFADTAGVPEDVAGAVNKERRNGLDDALYDAVVAVVNASPKAITIKQVIFVLHKLVALGQLEKVPAENTVRNYLNTARTNGDVGKPSRQSYWTADKDVADAEAGDDTTEAPATQEEAADAVEAVEADDELNDESDPLAD